MSLILEALKKSEAERRIGEAPGLLSPSTTAAAASRPPRTWLWIVLGLLLVLAMAAAWWLGRLGGPESTPGVAAPTGDVAVAARQTPVAATVAGSDSATADRGPVAASPAVSTPAPTAPPRNPPPRTTTTAPAPVVTAPRAAGERESLAVAPGELPPPEPRTMTPASAPTRNPAAAETTASQPRPQPPETDRESLPRLHQLDSATRSELPPLRISMHVFTDEPGGRFVIIDNHRHAEGASVASGLNIAEIRRDGVVMDFRGRRFLLDRPG